MATGGGNRRAKQELTEDLSNVEFETSEDVEVIPSFDSLALREDLLRGIYAYGMIYLISPRDFVNVVFLN